jgi:BolA family transcriptional regulator, general stress-responsive regulator
MKTRIICKLQDSLNPEHLEIINESHLHSGHGDFDGLGETHFRIVIKSQTLIKLPRVKAHQTIYQILAEEMQTIHALAIKILD